MALQGAFQNQLRLLADEYERLSAENAGYRTQLGLPPATAQDSHLAKAARLLDGSLDASQGTPSTKTDGVVTPQSAPPLSSPLLGGIAPHPQPSEDGGSPLQPDVSAPAKSLENGVSTAPKSKEGVAQELRQQGVIAVSMKKEAAPELPGMLDGPVAAKTADKLSTTTRDKDAADAVPPKPQDSENAPAPQSGPLPLVVSPKKEVNDKTSPRSSESTPSAPKVGTDAKTGKGVRTSVRASVRNGDNEDVMDEEAAAGGMNMLLLLDIVPAIAIIANGICTGVQTDFAEPQLFWNIMEYFFLVFFTGEMIVKIYLFGFREFAWGRDWYWGWFDIFCIGAGVVEIIIKNTASPSEGDGGGGGVGGLIKLLKLARLGRIVRLLKFKIFAELKSMIQGVFTGLKVLFWAVVLLFLLVYIFGLAVKILYTDMDRYPEFANLPSAMFTVFRCFTDGCAAFDGTPLQERMRLDPTSVGARTDVIFFFAYILIYLFVTVGIFNLIMAVFIDNVNDGSIKKKQHYLGMTADKTRWTLAEKFKALCEDEAMTPKDAFAVPLSDYIGQLMKDTMETIQYKVTGKKPQSQKEYELRANEITEEMEGRGLSINKEVFNSWLSSKDASVMDALDDAEIDVSMKFELFEVLDADLGGALDFGEIIDGLMRCRGPVSKVDIVSMGMKVRWMTKMLQEIHEKMEHYLFQRQGHSEKFHFPHGHHYVNGHLMHGHCQPGPSPQGNALS